MVDVAVEGDRVVFHVEGLHQLWALRSRLDIPLAHVTAVEINHEQVGNWWHGFKLLGTEMPGVLGAGTFFYHRQMVFWDVRDPAKTIIVSLEHELYKKLIVEVADPQATAAVLQSALRR
jgi:hypothetical protein